MDQQVIETTVASTDNLDELLADFDLREVVEEPIEEILEAVETTEEAEAVTEPDVELEELNVTEGLADLDISDDELQAVDTEIAKTEAYEAQAAAATPGTGTVDLSGEKPKKAKKEPKGKKAKSTAPAAPRDLSSLADGAFVLTAAPPADLAANRATVMAARPGQKKIAEKFDNLILSVAQGKSPSKYTMDCFRALQAKGTITQGELVAALRSLNSNRGSVYSEGTARSQVGQFMVLANVLGIATRTKNTLTMNSDSAFADALAKL